MNEHQAEAQAQHLTVEQLQTALERCMKVNPPTGGQECRLHVDASRIADVWALLIVLKAPSIPRSEVKASALEAYTRWAVS